VITAGRPLATLLTLAFAGVGLVGATTPANAAALPYTARVTPESSMTAANSIAGAGGHLFVADTNAVLVFDGAGRLETTITAIFGAEAITASPDGATVYVAESSAAKIATIDVATLLKTAEVTVSDCPSSLAVTSTTVFYASGCSTTGQINHLDRASGTPNDLSAPDATGFSGVPSVKSNSTTLYAMETFGALTAWPVSGATLGTPVAGTTSLTEFPEWAVGGGYIAVTNMNGYQFTLYDATTLAKIADLPATNYPRTVGFTPNGATLIGGVQNANTYWMYNPATGQNIRKTALADSNVWPAGGGIAFSADGTVAYMIGMDWTGDGTWHYSLIATTVGTPGTTHASVVVTQATRYGAQTMFTVTGTPNVTARLDVTSNGNIGHYNVHLGSSGKASLKLTKLYGGKVTATVPGDLTHSGFTSSAVTYRVPSRTSVSISKGYKKVNGVVYYHKASQAKQTVRVSAPVYYRAVTVILRRLNGGHWVKVQKVTIHTTSSGYGYTYMANAINGVSYRVKYKFKGDSLTNRSHDTTKVFRIG
jgi:YVTN family beta-propeller protein